MEKYFMKMILLGSMILYGALANLCDIRYKEMDFVPSYAGKMMKYDLRRELSRKISKTQH